VLGTGFAPASIVFGASALATGTYFAPSTELTGSTESSAENARIGTTPRSYCSPLRDYLSNIIYIYIYAPNSPNTRQIEQNKDPQLRILACCSIPMTHYTGLLQLTLYSREFKSQPTNWTTQVWSLWKK